MIVQEIPKVLIYEEVASKPIYYRGYQQVLQGLQKPEEIMGSSKIQSLIISRIMRFFFQAVPQDQYEIFTNEFGLHLKKGYNRACDIAIYEKTTLEKVEFDDKYMHLPPKIVLEVDTKADTEDYTTAMDYYYQKTQELLDFGVEKVIWLITESRKTNVATPHIDWVIKDWNQEIELWEGLSLNLERLV